MPWVYVQRMPVMPCSELCFWERLEDRGDESVVDLPGGPARVEKAYQHVVSPYSFRSVSSERNSLRRSGFLRKEPLITLLVILESMSLTPRHCMQ